jgi:hypothetical protein
MSEMDPTEVEACFSGKRLESEYAVRVEVLIHLNASTLFPGPDWLWVSNKIGSIEIYNTHTPDHISGHAASPPFHFCYCERPRARRSGGSAL